MKKKCASIYAMKKKSLILMFLLFAIVGVATPLSFALNSVSAGAQQTKNYRLENPASISGIYEVQSMGSSFYLRTESYEPDNKNKVRAKDYDVDFTTKFNFAMSDQNNRSYTIYSTSSFNYCLDISGGVSTDGAELQLYKSNSTLAQVFKIKEAYINDKFAGYVFLTGASDFTKGLQFKGKDKIVVQNSLPDQLDKSFLWQLNKKFDSNTTSSPGYFPAKLTGDTVQIDSGFHWEGGSSYWNHFSNIIGFDATAYHRLNDQGLPVYFDSFSPKLKQNYGATKHWVLWKNVKIENDDSTKINNFPIGGKVGNGAIGITYTDYSGNSVNIYERNIFNSNSGYITFDDISNNDFLSVSNNNLTFNKVGYYEIKVYYKIKCDNVLYFQKTFAFELASSEYNAEVVTAEEDEKVYANYTLKLDKNNNLSLTWTGDADKKYNNEKRLIEYIAGVNDYMSDEEKEKCINMLKDEVKKYGQYKVYFVNQPYRLSGVKNKYLYITEISQAESGSVLQNNYITNGPNRAENGIFQYYTKNRYFDQISYYRVYVQTTANMQMLRNVSYAFSSEDGHIENYSMDYCFMEVVEIFPYTLITNVYYTDISEGDNNNRIEYKSNSIIYNLTNDVRRIKFEVFDISGNQTVLYCSIIPNKLPSVNINRLNEESENYNYLTSGYRGYVFNGTQYEKILFSSAETAYEYILSNIFSQEEMLDDTTLYYDPLDMFTDYHYSSNQDLLDEIYRRFERVVTQHTIYPASDKDYRIVEEQMHDGTIYLDKNFSFTTNSYMPLFESYKIKFEYFDNNNNLMRSGYITYNGKYRYGETLFSILADNDDSKWVSGYVNFQENNIVANAGVSYRGYIVNNKPNMTILAQDGILLKNIQVEDGTEYQFDRFKILNFDADGVVKVRYNNQETIFDQTNKIEDFFNKNGLYQISICNKFAFEKSFSILVEGLSANVEGVEAFGETDQEVVYTTSGQPKIYVNGSLTEITPQINENDEKVYTFTPGDRQEVVIQENNKYFAFILLGEEVVLLPDYGYYDNLNITQEDLYESYQSETLMIARFTSDERNYSERIDSLSNSLSSIETQLNQLSSSVYKNIDIYQLSDIKNQLTSIIKELEALTEELYADIDFVDSIIQSENEIIKQNESYSMALCLYADVNNEIGKASLLSLETQDLQAKTLEVSAMLDVPEAFKDVAFEMPIDEFAKQYDQYLEIKQTQNTLNKQYGAYQADISETTTLSYQIKELSSNLLSDNELDEYQHEIELTRLQMEQLKENFETLKMNLVDLNSTENQVYLASDEYLNAVMMLKVCNNIQSQFIAIENNLSQAENLIDSQFKLSYISDDISAQLNDFNNLLVKIENDYQARIEYGKSKGPNSIRCKVPTEIYDNFILQIQEYIDLMETTFDQLNNDEFVCFKQKVENLQQQISQIKTYMLEKKSIVEIYREKTQKTAFTLWSKAILILINVPDLI